MKWSAFLFLLHFLFVGIFGFLDSFCFWLLFASNFFNCLNGETLSSLRLRFERFRDFWLDKPIEIIQQKEVAGLYWKWILRIDTLWVQVFSVSTDRMKMGFDHGLCLERAVRFLLFFSCFGVFWFCFFIFLLLPWFFFV